MVLRLVANCRREHTKIRLSNRKNESTTSQLHRLIRSDALQSSAGHRRMESVRFLRCACMCVCRAQGPPNTKNAKNGDIRSHSARCCAIGVNFTGEICPLSPIVLSPATAFRRFDAHNCICVVHKGGVTSLLVFEKIFIWGLFVFA